MSISRLFDGYNAGYAQELYEKFTRNPASVSAEWRAIFAESLDELEREGRPTPETLELLDPVSDSNAGTPDDTAVPKPDLLLARIARAAALVQAFRDHGHQLARIDPLGSDPPGHPQLDPAFFGTSQQDLARIPTSLVIEDGGDQALSVTLLQLAEIYCGSIGYQFEHLEDPDKVRWLWSEVESGRHSSPLAKEERIQLLERLTRVEGFERFLHRTYLGQKRFSIEGTDMLIPMLDAAISEAGAAGAEEVVLGMAHRGRLNVLTHIVQIDYATLLREFEGAPQDEGELAPAYSGTGDVKYHHGARGRYPLSDGSDMRVTLAPNPSHLEFVNPVVGGVTRVLQFIGPGKDDERNPRRVVPILMHGDAAFAAEGVVAESLNLARLRGYTVGGTVHIIVNNQIGFTTDPEDGRSTRYASDLAKGYDIPILHVNADDPAACLSAVRLAMAYRARFQDDVVIDLVGYRRFGHNEGDEPSYTQPLLYAKIPDHPTVLAQWAESLIEEEIVSAEDVRRLEEEVATSLREALVGVEEAAKDNGHAPPSRTVEAPSPVTANTATDLETLSQVNLGSIAVPDGFQVHPKLKRQLERRTREFGPDTRLDWAYAESLALGAILKDGVPIRLTGQDTQRGTFSQRHLVLHDVATGQKVTPLAGVGSARFEVYNSPLSEVAALGFEYGYSVSADKDLVLWEAQFGDFVNVAQVVVDQFIASGRAKWGQVSRLTLLLPHGHEGQGPEHSSARLERFLQLCGEDNIQVAYPTTPAQYFHLLRRQALATPVRPLVMMTPKSLLRLPAATSKVRELTDGSFRPILADPERLIGSETVTRLILCSGKMYYDLNSIDDREALEHVAIGRMEQLYPFPADELLELVKGYPNLEEVVWAQEEPRNMGALSFVGPRLRSIVPRAIPLRHVARPERASPAEGKNTTHQATQERIVRDAVGI